MKERMLSLVHVITPNIDEAAALTGLTVGNPEEVETAARRLHEMGVRNVIITGGHLDPPSDFVSPAGGRENKWLEGKKVEGRSTHGTGCAFSTALACNLALGLNLLDAARAAKQYVANALKKAVQVGKGHGPINHLFDL